MGGFIHVAGEPILNVDSAVYPACRTAGVAFPQLAGGVAAVSGIRHCGGDE
jgi:hypothetical protein